MWKPFPDWLVLPPRAQQAVFVILCLAVMTLVGCSIWQSQDADDDPTAKATPPSSGRQPPKVAPVVTTAADVHALIEDAGFVCAGYEAEDPDINALDSGDCAIDGVIVDMSVYRDEGAQDAVFGMAAGADCSAVVGDRWIIWPQSDDLARELADAIPGAAYRAC